MNHAPVRGERVCECWECLCVGRALVRIITSRSFAACTTATATATATAAAAASLKFFKGLVALSPK